MKKPDLYRFAFAKKKKKRIPNEYANDLKIMKDCTIHCKYTNRIENNLCWYKK